MAVASRMILTGENLFEKGIVIVNWCCTSKKSADTVFCLLTSVFGGRRTLGRYSFFFFGT